MTFLRISTGAGEVLAVLGSLVCGLTIPLTAVQLLWLNLVANGIQDVALALEPGEPGALDRPPPPPSHEIFDRTMIERTLLSAAVFSGVVVMERHKWWRNGREVWAAPG